MRPVLGGYLREVFSQCKPASVNAYEWLSFLGNLLKGVVGWVPGSKERFGPFLYSQPHASSFPLALIKLVTNTTQPQTHMASRQLSQLTVSSTSLVLKSINCLLEPPLCVPHHGGAESGRSLQCTQALLLLTTVRPKGPGLYCCLLFSLFTLVLKAAPWPLQQSISPQWCPPDISGEHWLEMLE